MLADQLAKSGVKNPEIIEFVGDDESAFIDAGIPVGGAESGDDEEKTRGQAKAWVGRPARTMTPATTRLATT
jgi:aminopeptidase S